jgi:hypothetical protein
LQGSALSKRRRYDEAERVLKAVLDDLVNVYGNIGRCAEAKPRPLANLPCSRR